MSAKIASGKFATAIFGLLILAALVFPGSAGAQENTDESPHHVSGCLRKAAEAGVFTLTDEEGKTWDLRSRTVPLANHVGHTVAVTGTIPKTDSKSDDPTPQNHLVVTEVKMVRDSCKVE